MTYENYVSCFDVDNEKVNDRDEWTHSALAELCGDKKKFTALACGNTGALPSVSLTESPEAGAAHYLQYHFNTFDRDRNGFLSSYELTRYSWNSLPKSLQVGLNLVQRRSYAVQQLSYDGCGNHRGLSRADLTIHRKLSR